MLTLVKEHPCLVIDHLHGLPGPLSTGCLSASCLSNAPPLVFLLLCCTVAFILLFCFNLLNISLQLDYFHIPGTENHDIITPLHHYMFPIYGRGQDSLLCSTWPSFSLVEDWMLTLAAGWKRTCAVFNAVQYLMHCFLECTCFINDLSFQKLGLRCFSPFTDWRDLLCTNFKIKKMTRHEVSSLRNEFSLITHIQTHRNIPTES